ncbi:vWA domain-containing protein [Frondihabitans cladoniiphilus]|uniref:VWA domain-containing protein n=1 Tax=Frondihabitans cladoniiphilus TaxID=715785 RepID=A0ABP8VK95_9MICO
MTASPALLVFQPVLPIGWFLAFAVVLLGFALWRVVAERANRGMLLTWVRRAVIVALLLVVAARPSLPGGTSPASVADLNVFFVVDTTSSSAAEDWNGTEPRLDGMRSDIDAITTDLAGARFSLISFDSTAIQRVPLTQDSSALVTAAKVMRQEVTYYSHGSSISEAHTLLAQVLAEAKKSNPERADVVYYLGDGEQTASSAPASFAASRADVDGGGVLGYGTAAGGRMKEFDGYGDQYSANRYIKDKTLPGSPDALSKIDPANLKTIASQLGVPYLQRHAGGSLASVVGSERRGEVVSATGTTASLIDLYWIAAIPAFLLLFVDIALVVRALGDVRPVRPSREPRADRGPRAGRVPRLPKEAP